MPPYSQNHGDVIICGATHSPLWYIMIMYKTLINDPPGWYIGTAANKRCSDPKFGCRGQQLMAGVLTGTPSYCLFFLGSG